jgi:AcrR family transcriptional regulator
MATTQREPRLPLNRDRILQTALELADEGGIESLTMRKLGQTLGFEAMSLYNYVANKGDLLDGILDLVLDESEPPSPDGEWHAAIRSSAISVHRALTRHPWACPLLMSPGHIRPARLQQMDSLLGRLRQAGFSAETTYHAYHVLDAHIYGFSLWQANHTYNAVQVTDMVSEFERMIPADVFPYLHEHGEQHFADGPHREVSAFEFGLDFILDGLAELVTVDRTREPSVREDKP